MAQSRAQLRALPRIGLAAAPGPPPHRYALQPSLSLPSTRCRCNRSSRSSSALLMTRQCLGLRRTAWAPPPPSPLRCPRPSSQPRPSIPRGWDPRNFAPRPTRPRRHRPTVCHTHAVHPRVLLVHSVSGAGGVHRAFVSCRRSARGGQRPQRQYGIVHQLVCAGRHQLPASSCVRHQLFCGHCGGS